MPVPSSLSPLVDDSNQATAQWYRYFADNDLPQGLLIGWTGTVLPKGWTLIGTTTLTTSSGGSVTLQLIQKGTGL